MLYDSKKNIIRKMKEVAQKIATEESIKKGIDIAIYPLTIVEYYRSDLFKNHLILVDSKNNKKLNYISIIEPFKYSAFYMNRQKKLVIFIKKLNKIKTWEFEIIWSDFIVSIYHELKHRFQAHDRQESKSLDFKMLVADIERLIHYFDYPYYMAHHDKFYMEIEAHLYGVDNALDYLKRTNSLTSLQTEHLEAKQKIYRNDLNQYDLQAILDKLNDIIRIESNSDIINLFMWLHLFYNQDKTFRTAEQILNHPDINLVDKKFLEAFLANKSFLESVDFESLNNAHQHIIMVALNNALNSEEMRRTKLLDALEKKHISASKCMEIDKIIGTRIMYYTQKIYELTICRFANKHSNNQSLRHR